MATAAETLATKIKGLQDLRVTVVARLADIDADLARLQAFAEKLSASADADLIESLWAEAQK